MKFFLLFELFLSFILFSQAFKLVSGTCTPEYKIPKLDFTSDFDTYETLKIKKNKSDSEARIKQKKDYNSLLKYMIDHGAKFRKFTMNFITGSNRYMRATKDIKKHEIVAIIPFNLMISSETKDLALLETKTEKIGEEFMGFVKWFLDIKSHTDNAYYKLYVNFIPKDMTNVPLLFTDPKDISLFKTSKILREEYESEKNNIKSNYDSFVKLKLIDGEKITFREFAIAYFNFVTRDFYYYDEHKKEQRLLVPIIDLFNYDLKDNMLDWNYSHEKKAFILWAMNNIKQGQEILINYGREHDNNYFFTGYGFTTKSVHFSDLNLERNGVKITLYSKPSRKNFMKTLKDIKDQLKSKRINSSELTRKALTILLSAIKDYSSDYTSSLEENKKKINTEKSFNQQNILRILINEKKVFRTYKKMATVYITKLKQL